ncbi:MAG: hypothetical protein Q4D85_00530 [Corynebacterium sp.]|uniref:hypothetical protein n=1 Tax=Corynebacterium sp. TaxID=1720 RepID=UPI0026DBE2E4|nr:hypothetical protein [Corynebacterium sp.]MDO5097211.1 hypothetical protein [Corynebacterium sp.]
MHIDIKEFFRTGQFGPINAPLNKTEVTKLLNSPDEEWDNDYGGSIWTYGNIELHFFDNTLTCVFTDHFTFAPLSAGDHISLEPWLFTDTTALSLAEVSEHLDRATIGYEIQHTSLNITMTLESGVSLIFENPDDLPNLPDSLHTCSAFSKDYRP